MRGKWCERATAVSQTLTVIAASVLSILAIGLSTAIAAPATGNVQIEYVRPTNPAHAAIYDVLRKARVLEYVAEMLGVIRLPRPLKVKLDGCEGISNAAYGNDEITVCYEFVDDIIKNAAERDLEIGITRQDTIIGPLVDVFLHEGGHAVFDYLRIPIWGREEDAADQFSSYVMLQYDKARARALILGSAYQYKLDMKQSEVALPLSKFSDEHGHPAQRFFNILCIAYGSDPKLFSDLVTRKLLPEDRAPLCEQEYAQVQYAFRTLIGSKVDKQAARRALKKRHKFKEAR
jgi:hypothetical protein